MCIYKYVFFLASVSHYMTWSEMETTPIMTGIISISDQYSTNLGAPEAKVLKTGTYVIKTARLTRTKPLLICWNERMAPNAWHKYKCTISLSPIPHLSMSKVAKDRTIQIIKFDYGRTWISPTTSLGRKMAHYRVLFLNTSHGLILSGLLIWIHISCPLQLR